MMTLSELIFGEINFVAVTATAITFIIFTVIFILTIFMERILRKKQNLRNFLVALWVIFSVTMGADALMVWSKIQQAKSSFVGQDSDILLMFLLFIGGTLLLIGGEAAMLFRLGGEEE